MRSGQEVLQTRSERELKTQVRKLAPIHVHRNQPDEDKEAQCHIATAPIRGRRRPSTTHRLCSSWLHEHAEDQPRKEPANMRRVVNTATNEPNAKSEHDVDEEQTSDATERFAQTSLHKGSMSPLCTKGDAEEGEDTARSANRIPSR
jgi:hypothetical protein